MNASSQRRFLILVQSWNFIWGSRFSQLKNVIEPAYVLIVHRIKDDRMENSINGNRYSAAQSALARRVSKMVCAGLPHPTTPTLLFHYSSFMRMRSANFDDIFHVTQPKQYHALFAWWPDLCLPPLSSHPLHNSLPPIPVWGEGASKGWGRKTQHPTTWPAALVPQLIQQRRVDSYSLPGVNSLNKIRP